MCDVWTNITLRRCPRHGDIIAQPYEPVRMWYDNRLVPLDYSVTIYGAPSPKYFSLGPDYPPGYWVDNYMWKHCLEPISFDWIRSINSYDFPMVDELVDFKWGTFWVRNSHYLDKVQNLYSDKGTWVENNIIDCKTIYSFHN